MHFTRKIASTVRLCATLFMARTFGKYVISIGDGPLNYAVYYWRGREWAFPTSAMEWRGM